MFARMCRSEMSCKDTILSCYNVWIVYVGLHSCLSVIAGFSTRGKLHPSTHVASGSPSVMPTFQKVFCGSSCWRPLRTCIIKILTCISIPYECTVVCGVWCVVCGVWCVVVVVPVITR